jgi:LAO/AO transport system kinase
VPVDPAAQIDRLLEQFEQHAPAALARAISIVENRRPGFDRLLSALHPRLGRARRIGITGPPGGGKSTLTTRLAARYREDGLRVAIVAVDPTSPFTGGALLGDRIRMEDVALDPGVFIRSLATRGSLGGLSAATRAVADVLDAHGFDRILLETVGVGQSELDIARAADTTLVMLVPESGDSIQTLKAGLMEIADLFAVNKADRPGADRLANDIELMLGLRQGEALRGLPAHHGVDLTARNPARLARKTAAAEQLEGWVPPVLRLVARTGDGIDELMEALERHARYLDSSGELTIRRRRRLREQIVEITEHTLRRRLWDDAGTQQWLDAALPRVEANLASPFAVADELIGRSGHLLTGTTS